MQVLACGNGEFLTQFVRNHNKGLNIKSHICTGDVIQVDIASLGQFEDIEARLSNIETYVGVDPNSTTEPTQRPFIDYEIFSLGFGATITLWAMGKGIGLILKQIKIA